MTYGTPFDQQQWPVGLSAAATRERLWRDLALVALFNRNPVHLPKFSGKESLQGFLNQIENAAEMGNWPEAYKAGQVYAQLTGPALAYIDGQPQEHRRDFTRLCGMLRARYEGDLERQRCREALRVCRRRRQETLEELASRIKELARKAYPPDQREEESILALKAAVSDRQAEALIMGRFQTLEQCVHHLSQLEAHTERTRDAGRGRIGQVAGNQATLAPASQAPGQSPSQPQNGQKKSPNRPQHDRPHSVSPEDLQKALTPILRKLDALQDACNHKPPDPKRPRPNRPPESPKRTWSRRHQSPSRGPCYKCGSSAHWANQCPKQPQDRQQDRKHPLDDARLDTRSNVQSSRSSQ